MRNESYMGALRRKIGNDLVISPSVTAIIHDDAGRLLLCSWRLVCASEVFDRALIGTLNSRLQNVHTVRDVPGKVNCPPSVFFISTTCLRACSVLIHTKQRQAP